jgi:hypothetical protein
VENLVIRLCEYVWFLVIVIDSAGSIYQTYVTINTKKSYNFNL